MPTLYHQPTLNHHLPQEWMSLCGGGVLSDRRPQCAGLATSLAPPRTSFSESDSESDSESELGNALLQVHSESESIIRCSSVLRPATPCVEQFLALLLQFIPVQTR